MPTVYAPSGCNDRPNSIANTTSSTTRAGPKLKLVSGGDPYFREDWLQAERTRIFAHSWQLAGDVARIRRPGTYAVYSTGNEEVIVARTDAGDLVAFSNVCQHRGHPVATSDGEGTSVTCRYHGCRYELTEQTITSRGLPPVAVREMGPLVFVCVSPTAASEPPFGDLADQLKGYAGHRPEICLSWDVASNWKLVVENFAECLHCTTVHPETLALRVDLDHYRVEPRGDHAVHFIRSVQPQSLARGAPVQDQWETDRLTYWLWPNSAVSLLPDHLITFVVRPTSPERSVLHRCVFGPPGDTCDSIAEYLQAVGDEDIAVVEALQRNVKSMHWPSSPSLDHREVGVHHFRTLVGRAMG